MQRDSQDTQARFVYLDKYYRSPLRGLRGTPLRHAQGLWSSHSRAYLAWPVVGQVVAH